MISQKEHEERKLELFKMLLPEMISEKLKYYNVDKMPGCDSLAEVLESNHAGTGLLDILKGRIPKAQNAGCDMFIQKEDKAYFTELGVISENLEILFIQLGELLTILKENNIPLTRIENVTASVAMIFYSAGAHDMKVNLERHSIRGVKARTEIPSKGGAIKAEKSLPLKKLVGNIVTSVNENPKIVNIKKPLLARVIFQVISDFSSTGNNRNFKCFSCFLDGSPTEATIRSWLTKLELVEKVTTDKRSASLIKLIEIVKSEFPPSKIKLIIN